MACLDPDKLLALLEKRAFRWNDESRRSLDTLLRVDGRFRAGRLVSELIVIASGLALWLSGSLAIGAVYASIVTVQKLCALFEETSDVLDDLTRCQSAVNRLNPLRNERFAAVTPCAQPVRDALALKGVSFSYDGENPVLDGVNAVFKPGQMCAIVGASGCGKSLTLRCIAGIETPDEGRIVVNDQVFFDSEQRVNLTPQKRKTALLFQSYMLFPNLTVAENVGAGIERAVPRGVRDAIVATELKRFGLEGFDKRYPAQLSGGQQQRVALARMLAARPGILMLDEPFSALDAHLKGVLEQNLVSLFDAYDGTILYVSHDIDEALRFCDRIAVVEAGRIMETGTGDDLVNRPQSLAGVKLSGCKNATPAERMGEHRVRLPKWGIEVATAAPVREDVTHLGVRAFYLERASGPGENCYRVRVDRVSARCFWAFSTASRTRRPP